MIAFDIDGVLTSGRISVDAAGTERKVVHLSDLDYMNRLAREGYLLAAITGEETPICAYLARRFPWNDFIDGCKEKDAALRSLAKKYALTADEICYVGDGCVEELYHRLMKPRDTQTPHGEPAEPDGRRRALVDDLAARYPRLSSVRQSIYAAYSMMEESYARGGKLLIAGNGGSASDAEHIVGELMKSFARPRPIPARLAERLLAVDPARGETLREKLEQPLTAISLTTHESLSSAFLNDVDGRYAFAQQLLGFGRRGDVFLAISTSGNSENVLCAAVAAKAMDIRVVGLTGKDGGELARLADCAVIVPEHETFKIQELHLPIYHCWCRMLEERFFGND